MSLQACADLVARGDPRRFRAAMAAPLPARAVLLPLYAFNIEVSRAPWVTEEPMIAEMRLQWWRDALEELGKGQARRHDVVDALHFLNAEQCARLDRLVAARRWDIYRDAFEDSEHFHTYLQDTTGALIDTGISALGGKPSELTAAIGAAAGLARFFQAIPNLQARGRLPLVDGRPEAVASLSKSALRTWPKTHKQFGHAKTALYETAGARAILRRAARDPLAVSEGRLEISPLSERWHMIRAHFFNSL